MKTTQMQTFSFIGDGKCQSTPGNSTIQITGIRRFVSKSKQQMGSPIADHN